MDSKILPVLHSTRSNTGKSMIPADGLTGMSSKCTCRCWMSMFGNCSGSSFIIYIITNIIEKPNEIHMHMHRNYHKERNTHNHMPSNKKS